MHFYEGRKVCHCLQHGKHMLVKPSRSLERLLFEAESAICHASGEQVITQGQTGATFYIMFSGSVDVYKDG